MPTAVSLFIVFVLGCVTPSFAAPLIIRDVVYARTANAQPLLLDWYIPAGLSGSSPVVIYVHGGGWSSGSKYTMPTFFRDQTKFIVASINYRLTAAPVTYNPTDAEIWQAQIEDVRAAIRYVKAGPGLAAHGISVDPARVGLYGWSAGAQLAGVAAFGWDDPMLDGDLTIALDNHDQIPPNVKALVAVSGPHDLRWRYLNETQNNAWLASSTTVEARLLGGAVGTRLPLALSASPISRVRSDAVPTLLIHGLFDTTVAKEQSMYLADALAAVDADVTLLLSPGAHQNPPNPTDATDIVQFFAEHL